MQLPLYLQVLYDADWKALQEAEGFKDASEKVVFRKKSCDGRAYVNFGTASHAQFYTRKNHRTITHFGVEEILALKPQFIIVQGTISQRERVCSWLEETVQVLADSKYKYDRLHVFKYVNGGNTADLFTLASTHKIIKNLGLPKAFVDSIDKIVGKK